jgi:hypothetical protein
MSYPTVTINRSASLEKPTGIGQGRMIEGTVVGAFRTFKSFPFDTWQLLQSWHTCTFHTQRASQQPWFA